jgi:hypothetical protein
MPISKIEPIQILIVKPPKKMHFVSRHVLIPIKIVLGEVDMAVDLVAAIWVDLEGNL